MNDLDLHFVEETVARIGTSRQGLIPILQALQDEYGWLPEEALRRVTELTEIPPAAITGVSSFYDQFRHRPVGEHLIHVCVGTACHVKGAESVIDALRTQLQVPEDGDTDPDGRFTLQKVACMGCCTLAPVARIDEHTYGHLTSEAVGAMLEDFLSQSSEAGTHPTQRLPSPETLPATQIRIGLGSCCVANGSARVRDAIETALVDIGAPGSITLKRVGCVGMCHQTPLVEIVPAQGPSTLYANVKPEEARSIVLRHFTPKGLLRRIATRTYTLLEHAFTDESWADISSSQISLQDQPVAAFLGKQQHLATELCGVLDPTDLEEYLTKDGFLALRRCLEELSPEEIIAQIDESGLRGRGGAGFPSGEKWRCVREQAVLPKYLICNGDEGDPGAFMDRMLLESYPYRIIEGMITAAYAVGASQGLFYIRAEYPLAITRVREAIRRCEQRGLLGDNILGSSFSFNLDVAQGAGAFVCGEETALIASIEGRRGTPRLRPPFPAISGLYQKPTLVSNVETYALVPWIIRNGPAAFATLGTPTSKGTKVFALAGKIRRGGLIEVPMGMTIRQIVEEIGGGIQGDRRFKAVQVGGPSGGCIPASLAETPVDYEALAEVGAMMGSGGLVVLDEQDCMVDIARYFLSFTQDQSCGKCTFCRVGTAHMLGILTRLCEGKGVAGDLERLKDLADSVRVGSLCGLGKTAPNPVLSTLQYFRHEYEAHLEGHCPAGVCKQLITYTINDSCYGCTRCVQVCPAAAIEFRPHAQHEIDPDRCTRCGACVTVCPVDAVTVE